jgi:hypothetical protein
MEKAAKKPVIKYWFFGKNNNQIEIKKQKYNKIA